MYVLILILIFVATDIYAIFQESLRKIRNMIVQNKGEGGVKGRSNNVKKNRRVGAEVFPKLPSHPSPIFMRCCRYLGNMVFGLGGTQELSLPMMTVLRRFLRSLAQFQTLYYPHTGSQYSWLWLESSTSWRFPSSVLWERHKSLISDEAHYGGPVVCLSDDLWVRTCSC